MAGKDKKPRNELIFGRISGLYIIGMENYEARMVLHLSDGTDLEIKADVIPGKEGPVLFYRAIDGSH